MPKFFIALIAGILVALVANGGALSTPATAAPKSDADKAALEKATAKCRAEVKEEARYYAMSLYARHKRVKKCIQDSLAAH